MMSPWQYLKAANAIGFGNLFRTLTYQGKKRRLDRAYLKREAEWDRLPLAPLGAFTSHATPAPHTAVLRFERGELEVAAMSDGLLRLTFTPGKLPVPYALSGEAWPMAVLEVAKHGDDLVLSTAAVELRVAKDGAFQFGARGDQAPLCRFDAPARQGERWHLAGPLGEREAVYGLGQASTPLNLVGHTRTLYNSEARGDYNTAKDPLYLNVPVYYGLTATGGHLAFFENSFRSRFSFKDGRRALRFEGGALRLYLTPGPLASALDVYTRLSGRPALPPRWALGYHQARWSYLNEAEVEEVLAGFREHHMPLSALHLDIHYMDGYRVFTVDRRRYPDLKRVAASLAKQDATLITILDPGIKVDENYPLYREFREKGLFCTMPDGSEITGPVWPGRTAFPDFTNPAARERWGACYRMLLDEGVGGIWHDMNEPAVFTATGFPTLPDSTRHDLDGTNGDHLEAHNFYALLENRAAYEGILKARPEKRPWMLTRSGWAGIQRFAWNWTGDTGSNWWSLKQNIRLPLMLGLSGVPYTGSDIGGFNGEPDAELYVRWFEAASFLPFFRTHSAAFVARREPWFYGEPATSICRRYLQLRYRLMPTWYTLAHEATRSGLPLLRPLFMTNEADLELREVDDEFLLGDALLVAPVVEAKEERKVVLPRGTWIHVATRAIHEGPTTITVKAPLDSLPLFVRAGGMVGLEENGLALLAVATPTTRRLEGRLVLDAGDGWGESLTLTLAGERRGDTLTFVLTAEGGYVPKEPVWLRLSGLAAQSAAFDGAPLTLDAARGLALPAQSGTLVLKVRDVELDTPQRLAP